MRFTLLGLGGWISDPILDTVSVLVDVDGFKILIDCGESIVKRLRYVNVDLEDLDLVVVTHSHGDHVLGLPTLIIWSAYRSKIMKILTLKDTYEDIIRLLHAVHIEKHIDIIQPITVERAKEPLEVFSNDKVIIKVVETCHSIPCIAVRVEDRYGRSLVYTGDTARCDSIVKLANNCDILIHEVSGIDPASGKYGHSCVMDSIEVACMSNAKILVPVHYYAKFDIIYNLAESRNVNVLVPAQYVWYDVDELLDVI